MVLLAMAQFQKGGQTAYYHEYSPSERLDGGFFHTYPDWNACSSRWGKRKIAVFLPRDYDNSGRSYPVLYTHDGDAVFYKGGAAGKTWWLGQTISNLKRDGKIEDFITVAINPINRMEEYTHAFFAPGQDCCKVDEYTRFLLCLKKWIDTNYRTKSDAANTAVMGSSHGGLASFYIANTQPNVFGKAACLSSSFWAGYDPIGVPSLKLGGIGNSELVKLTQKTLKSPNRPHLFIDYGLTNDQQFHNSVIEKKAATTSKEMVNYLKGLGYKTYFTRLQGVSVPPSAALKQYELFVLEDQDGQHTEDAWANRVWVALTFLFPK
jgi:hypothetical protein